MDADSLRKRLKTARANELEYLTAGDPANAAKWARFARFLNELIERKGL
jgi:hypothetical protein